MQQIAFSPEEVRIMNSVTQTLRWITFGLAMEADADFQRLSRTLKKLADAGAQSGMEPMAASMLADISQFLSEAPPVSKK